MRKVELTEEEYEALQEAAARRSNRRQCDCELGEEIFCDCPDNGSFVRGAVAVGIGALLGGILF